ncbi:MAG: 3-deoxy-7-phosphoheptulonate synthase [Deltaproteobacteria bacterium]|nr:3-deoxy-7-phosphoheptulonate synthase [Deltaproteobacteria bacterium]
MVIIMEPHASPAQIEAVVRHAERLGLRAHLSPGAERTIIGLVGDGRLLDPPEFTMLEGVSNAVRVLEPYKLASRHSRPEGTRFPVGAVTAGGAELLLIAGPCSVESREQILETAHAVKEAGATALRGGAFKPRSSPYAFQGMGLEGLKLLAEAREATGLPVVTEVMGIEEIAPVVEYADVLQIGARNMQNFNLLKAVGQCRKPVLLKRGLMSTLEELLMSAEYILAQGNAQVMLCERGIRTFETYTRNTFDINAIPVLKHRTHLPVIADPSHATGQWQLVAAASRAAVAAGADGLIVEVHPAPERALSDGPQSLKPERFAELVREVRAVARAVGRNA